MNFEKGSSCWGTVSNEGLQQPFTIPRAQRCLACTVEFDIRGSSSVIITWIIKSLFANDQPVQKTGWSKVGPASLGRHPRGIDISFGLISSAESSANQHLTCVVNRSSRRRYTELRFSAEKNNNHGIFGPVYDFPILLKITEFTYTNKS
ncbi:hypothetical protein INS49_000078 [Diaporthe citri]|uniref:uncharacterized protein n=1 Tax=Diaporthe citri TaxID=83186 RepID=UPI001C80A186|nr:uncharacterized protein INS49_000078 [Diaporthe citri]KAG6365902.1 hypothetical protein INS49_000078 [Diaporthe citri]